MEVTNVNDVLKRFFPGYQSLERAAAWEAIKRQFALGSKVEGVVFAQFPFGVFLDINAGFPALLLVTRMSDQPRTPAQYPAIGSTLDARICVWVNSRRQIGLTELKREPTLGEN